MPKPKIAPSAVLYPGAVVSDDVTLGENVTILYNAVLRGDISPITVGNGTNIQDNAVVHPAISTPVSIGSGCTIGHGAIVHGCTVGDNTLIGMGAIVLNRAVIGRDCIIGAGTLVTQGAVIPDGHMAYGSPAKVIRPLTEAEIASNRRSAELYAAQGQAYSSESCIRGRE